MRKGSNSPSSFRVGDVVDFVYEVDTTKHYVISKLDFFSGGIKAILTCIEDDRFTRIVPIEWIRHYSACKKLIKAISIQ